MRMLDEQTIEIQENGQIILNNQQRDTSSRCRKPAAIQISEDHRCSQ
jgi:hypothetical protein